MPRNDRSRAPSPEPTQQRGHPEPSEALEALARRALEFAAERFANNQQNNGSSPRGGDQQSRGPLDTNDVTTMLLIQAVQYLLRRYLHRHLQARSTSAHQIETNRGLPLPNRETDELIPALDDVLHRLRATEELVERTIYCPATHEGCEFHRSVIANVGGLRASIGRTSATIRNARETLLGGRSGERGTRGRRRHRRGSGS